VVRLLPSRWLAVALAALIAGCGACLPAAAGPVEGVGSTAEMQQDVNRLLADGDVDGALALAARHLRLSPDSPEILAELVRILAAGRRNAEAIARYESLPDAYRPGRPVRLAAGRCYRLEGRFEQAKKTYRSILEENPGDEAATRGLVLTLFDMGRSDEALALLDLAQARKDRMAAEAAAPPVAEPEPPPDLAEQEREDIQDSLYLIRELLEVGRPEEAARRAGAAVERHPQNVELLLVRARVERACGDFAAALRTYDVVLAIEPSNREARRLKAVLLVDLAGNAEPDAAAPLLEQALKLTGEPPEIRSAYALALARAGQAAEAIRQYEALPADFETSRELREAVAASYRAQKDFANAGRAYRSVLAEHPGARAVLLALVDTLAEAGEGNRARELVTQALADRPTDRDLLFAGADLAAAALDYSEALATYNHILTLYPDSREAAQRKGSLLAEASRFSDCEAALDLSAKAVELTGGSPEAEAAQILALARCGRCAQAVARYEDDGLPAGAATPDVLRAVARCYREQEQFAEAAELFRQILAAEPDDLEAARERVRSLADAGDAAGALGAVRDGLQRHPTSPDLLLSRAAIEREQGGPAAALQTYDQALALRPGDPGAAAAKASLLHELALGADRQAAAELLREAVELDPASREAFADYLLVLARADRSADVIRAYESRPPEMTPDPDVLATVARCYRDEGDFGRAEEMCRALFEEEPGDPDVALAWVTTRSESGNPEGAREAAGQALLHQPRNLRLLFLKAALETEVLDFSDAYATYDRILEIDPENRQAARRKAGLMARIARFSEPEAALAFIEQAVLLAPDEPEVRAEYVLILARCGRLEDALKQYEALPPEWKQRPELREALRGRGVPDAPPPANGGAGQTSGQAGSPGNTNAGTRGVRVSLDLFEEAGRGSMKENLDRLAARLVALNADTVILHGFSAPYDGAARSVYFPSSVLPMKRNLLGRAADRVRRAGLTVYVCMPTLAVILPDPDRTRRLQVMVTDAGVARPSLAVQPRLSPFNAEVWDLLSRLYEELAVRVRFDGIVFNDDAYLTDEEDYHPDAVATAQHALGIRRFHHKRLSRSNRAKWTDLKVNQIDGLLQKLMEVVRRHQPDATFGRLLYAPVLHHPPSSEWLAQDYQKALSRYDRVIVEAYPEREESTNPELWLERLVKQAARYPSGPASTVFELQAYDWERRQWIAGQKLARRLQILREHGARHTAYCPDDFLTDKPELSLIQTAGLPGSAPGGKAE